MEISIKKIILRSAVMTLLIFLFFEASIYIIFLFFHEVAHCLTAINLGYNIDKIALFPFGFYISFKEEALEPVDDILIALSGPAFNLIAFFLFFIASYIHEMSLFFALPNLVLFIFNMLPAGFLDGGRILKSFFKINFSFYLSYLLTEASGIVLGGVIIILRFYYFDLFEGIAAAAFSILIIINGIRNILQINYRVIREVLNKYLYASKNRRYKIKIKGYDGNVKLFDIIKESGYGTYMIVFLIKNNRLKLKYFEGDIVDLYLRYGNLKLKDIPDTYKTQEE